jgi:hypothetical protein
LVWVGVVWVGVVSVAASAEPSSEFVLMRT